LEAEAPIGKLCVLNLDVAVERDCERLVNHAIQQFGSIDILINNAGISMRGLVEEGGKDIIGVIKRVMDINYFGTV
jgi:NAD(P)-dependent dehydrogenase (short-subunit alcohol dehydrogenase family)